MLINDARTASPAVRHSPGPPNGGAFLNLFGRLTAARFFAQGQARFAAACWSALGALRDRRFEAVDEDKTNAAGERARGQCGGAEAPNQTAGDDPHER